MQTPFEPLDVMTPSPLALAGDRTPLPLFRYLTPAAGAVADLEAGCCRWPFGAPGEPGFRFCGGLRIARSSYCTVHTQLARAGGRPALGRGEPRA